MNLSPSRYSDLLGRIEELSTQVAALFALVGTAKPRDPSITGFCRRHGISRGTFQRMRERGIGPRETAVGANRIAILEEDERHWVEARQAAVDSERGERGNYRQRAHRDAAAVTPAE